MSGVVRRFAPGDKEAVNAIARAAFAGYAGHYADWPSFIEGIGRMADLAADGDLLRRRSGCIRVR
jgi:hypothetical protein